MRENWLSDRVFKSYENSAIRIGWWIRRNRLHEGDWRIGRGDRDCLRRCLASSRISFAAAAAAPNTCHVPCPCSVLPGGGFVVEVHVSLFDFAGINTFTPFGTLPFSISLFI
ncbi:hypothetical protein [Rhizobium sullae]|uniref:Uncharacterized protein n=1 Tax=Rhizobium sullae TaxID=50338 RepID=A0A4R3Q3A7_RHISU|nr:hypothetical protein [Rhizobium sullae]TCU14777.1 hypothetical protein EV132_108147 [Rhizobium sullae]